MGACSKGLATIENDDKAATQDLYQSLPAVCVGKRALLGPFFFFIWVRKIG